MPDPDPLLDLRTRFVERCRERVANLRRLIDTGAAAGVPPSPSPGTNTADPTPAGAIVRLAHQLAGAAGTFGYPAMSEAAAALEDHARAIEPTARAFDPTPLEPFIVALEDHLAELGAARR